MGYLDNKQPGGLLGQNGGLMNFLQSPEAMALAQGLLAGGQPSFTEVPSLGLGMQKGLAGMLAAREKKIENERGQRWLDLQESIAERKGIRKIPVESRKQIAAFIKQYPQYANEKVEDILAVVSLLNKLQEEDPQMRSEFAADAMVGQQE